MRSANLFAVLIFGACVSATGPALAQQPVRKSRSCDKTFQIVRTPTSRTKMRRSSAELHRLLEESDGATRVSVRLTGRPNTTYHFFLKCVRLLGDITTQGDCSAAATFDFKQVRRAMSSRSTCTPKARRSVTNSRACKSIFATRRRRPPPVIAQLNFTRSLACAARLFRLFERRRPRPGPLAPRRNGIGARWSNDTTRVSVRLTGRPNTTYHFFLKCVRLLVDITTQGDGSAAADFDFPTNSAGDVFAFDMYPEGAPLGDKFQSVQVNFGDPPPPPPPPPVEVSPRVLYLSQTATGISIAYAEMPAGPNRFGERNLGR